MKADDIIKTGEEIKRRMTEKTKHARKMCEEINVKCPPLETEAKSGKFARHRWSCKEKTNW